MNSSGDTKQKLTQTHSLYTTSLPLSKTHTQHVWKSDIYLVPPNELTNLTGGHDVFLAIANQMKSSGEYYKRYEHDEIPVKESNLSNSDNGNDEGQKYNGVVSLTNAEVELMESTVLKSNSQKLDADNSYSSLESNVKFFRTTVQQIFDNFYSTMQDFEVYKQKFQLILQKNRAESIAEMEDFIKDMIQHIMSSDSVCNVSHNTSIATELKDDETVTGDTHSDTLTISEAMTDNVESIIEAYKNDNYLTDSITDEKSIPTKSTQDALNIYLLGHAPFLEIKVNERNQLSEINIRDSSNVENQVASAEDLKKLAAKRKELDKYVKQIQVNKETDREIPVKISSPKKNIHLDEDFSVDREKTDKSFLAKICNYICKRFRKAY